MNYKTLSMILGISLLLSASCSNHPNVRNLAVLDENIPVAYIDVYEHLHQDLNAITNASEVVFIGRVVDYKERLIIAPPDADMLSVAESDWQVVDVYEGIVLEADEVLFGEMPESESRITLAVHALQETLDGTSRSRIVDLEIAIFEDGIRSIGSDDSPRYLVYAQPSDLGTKEHALGLYWIKTSGGAVRVYDDGSLAYGKGRPFVHVWGMNEEGEYDWVLPYDLQDARDAAELAKSGIEDTSGIPEEQSTGIEEEPVEEPNDTSDSLLESESEQSLVELLPVFDETIPTAFSSMYEDLANNIDEISEDSHVIFLGRVVDYKEKLMEYHIDSIDWERYWIYDGIVMQADEVLLGEMPEPDEKMTLAALALTVNADRTPHSRHIDREIDIFSEGIKSIGAIDTPQYLVYAGSSKPGTQEYEVGLFWIISRAGAVRVYDDGSLGYGKGRPFVHVWGINEEGEYDWVFPYDLQDARDAAELAKSGIEDTSGIPEEQSTGLEEDSSEQSGESSGQDDTDEEPPLKPEDSSTGGDVSDQADTDEAPSPQPSDSDADTTQSSDGGEGSGDAGEDQSVDPVPDGSGGESAPQGESAGVDSSTSETGDEGGQAPSESDVGSPGG